MNEYIIDTSRKSGVHDATVFGAKVTNIEKVNEKSKWRVSWTELEDDEAVKVKEREKEDVSYFEENMLVLASCGSRLTLYQLFDAVVVASGHYHAPRIPDITGLADIKRLWPSRVLHSKGYRKPDSYAGKVRL
jgi:hypothetical protein